MGPTAMGGMRGVLARYKEEGGASPRRPGFGPGAASLEKGGFVAQVKAVGLSRRSGLFWGDEMRVGLMGPIRRVGAAGGVKGRQVGERTYLHLAINGLEGRLHWEWTADMKQDSF